MQLEELGWDSAFAREFEPYTHDNLIPARVATQHGAAYDLLAEAGELRVAHVRAHVEQPAVGDWVAVGGETIHAVLPRRSVFARTAASDQHRRTERQVLAANVDVVFLVTSLGPDLNLRRLERYLAAAWESGASPAIVLTKADTAPEEVPAALAEIEAIAFGVPVHAVSSVTGDGVDALAAYLAPGRTVALLGSSGVGKSTLVNRLAGRELLATREVRADGRGRHTTTHRELVLLPGGGLVLDTPGLRELQLWDGSLDAAFADVAELAARCRFRDCRHDREPGCAVRETLPPERLDSWRKLQRELASLEIRQSKALKAAARKERRAFARQLRRTQ